MTASVVEERLASGRVWAGGSEGTLVERIAFAYQPSCLVVPFLRVLPLALDTSMLLNQVTYVVRKGSSGLLLAADLGLLRMYVGETVCGEVERNLVHRADSGGFNPQDLFAAWNNEVRPRLRVVDTTGIESDALDRLRLRGAWSDRPTAVLSIALGAQLTIADDPDLLDEQYAVRFTAAVHLLAPREAAIFDLSAHYALVLSADGLRVLGTTLRQTLAEPGRGRTVIIVISLLALGALGVLVLRDPQRARQTAVGLVRDGTNAFEELVGFRLQAGRDIPEPLLPSADAPLWLGVARLLALAPAPMTPDEISTLVYAPRAACDATLHAHRLFVEGPDGWQLGDW